MPETPQTTPPDKGENTQSGPSRSQTWFWAMVGAVFGLSLAAGLGLSSFGQRRAPAPVETLQKPQEKKLGKPIRVGVVTGKVLTSGRKPLAGAKVRITQLGRRAAGEAPKTIETVTDNMGEFRTGPVTRLGHKLDVEAQGHTAHSVDRVMPGSDPVEIELIPGRGLTGRITRGGTPVASAEIRIASAGMWPQISLTSGPDGTFITPALPEGDYKIMARSWGPQGSAGVVAEVSHDGLTATEPIEIPLEPAVSLKLLVEDADTGAPISGAQVTLAEDVVHVLSLSAWSNDAGEVVFHGLPREQYRLTLAGPGYLQVSPRVDLSAAPPVEELIASLQRAGAVRGTVTDAVGSPLSLVRLTAHVTTTKGQQWVISRDPTFNNGAGGISFEGAFGFFSDEDGSFEVVGLPPGTMFLEAQLDGFETALIGPMSLGLGAQLDGVEIRLRQGHEIQGRVVDPEGTPVAGARVTIEPSTGPIPQIGPLPGMRALIQRTLTTDESGRFSTDDLPPQVNITATAEGFIEASISADLTDGEPVEVALGAQGDAIRGRVVQRGGGPLEGVLLWHLPPPGKGARRADLCASTTDTDGRFELLGCPEDTFWLEAIPPEESPVAPWFIEMTPGEDREIALDAKIPLKITAQASPEEPISGAKILISLSKAPANWPPWISKRAREQASTDAEGHALFERYSEGSFAVEVEAKGFETWTGSVDLEGEQGKLAVTLRKERLVEGAVSDRYGSPVEGARVRLDAARGTSKRTRTDALGQFSFAVGAQGELALNAVHPAIGRGQHTVPAEDDGEEIVITLDGPVVDLSVWGDAMSELGAPLWQDGDRVVIESIGSDSPADRAGLTRGDTLLEVRQEGTAVKATVLRENREVSVRLKAAPSEP